MVGATPGASAAAVRVKVQIDLAAPYDLIDRGKSAGDTYTGSLGPGHPEPLSFSGEEPALTKEEISCLAACDAPVTKYTPAVALATQDKYSGRLPRALP